MLLLSLFSRPPRAWLGLDLGAAVSEEMVAFPPRIFDLDDAFLLPPGKARDVREVSDAEQGEVRLEVVGLLVNLVESSL